jgi:hypothetical protein
MTTTKPPIAMLDLTATTGELPLLSADPTAAPGPILSLIRQSASPAASDFIGIIKFDGMDAGSVRQAYASIWAQILDPTAGSEDGALSFSTYVAGVDTVTMTLRDARVGIGNSAPAAKLHVGASSEAPVTYSPSIYAAEAGTTTIAVRDATNDTQWISGAQSGSVFTDALVGDGGRNYSMVNSAIAGFWYDAPGGTGSGLVLGAGSYTFGDPQQLGVQMHGNPYSLGSAVAGTIAATNVGAFNVMSLNRSSGDGELVAWYSAGTFIGNITCSGGVVSYNAFSGSHWSQLETQVRAEILRGTIVDSIDAMCSWGGEEPDFEEHLPKFKVSDTAGSTAVYGVFMDWMHKTKAPAWGDMSAFDEDDALITSLGACMIRVDAGVEVKRGDLIESAGNGCGRVQADDIFRSSTVAKVTANVKIEEYPDGSYLVPCTLHCG